MVGAAWGARIETSSRLDSWGEERADEREERGRVEVCMLTILMDVQSRAAGDLQCALSDGAHPTVLADQPTLQPPYLGSCRKDT